MGVVTLTLLSLLGFGMAYPDKNQVSTNAKLRYDSGEKAQALPKDNQLSEIPRLNDKFNEFINSPSVKAQVEQISRTARRQNFDLESLNELRDNLARLPQKSALLYPLILKDSLELVLVTPESPPIHRTVAVKRENLYRPLA